MRITIESRDLSYRQYTERISVTKFGHVNESNYIIAIISKFGKTHVFRIIYA